MLPACAAASVGVDAQILLVNLHVQIFLDVRHHVQGHERGLALALGIRGEVKDIGWGNQIRSYVLQPYKMVKDLRTDVETGNTDAVLDGGLDLFINGYLKWISVSQKQQ